MVIMVGQGDKVVFRRNSERLAAEITGSVLRIVEGRGHMVHHFVPHQVDQAVDSVTEACRA